jgi:predicted  nucleic acid-binding Zn-ribbon protein
MSDTSPRPRSPRRPTAKPPGEATASPPSHATERHKTTGELAALLRLAELDVSLLDREDARRAPVHDEVADERHGLGAKLSMEVLEAYERALRAGRRPAVVRLVASVCSGCHMRLHSKLDHQIRRRRGIAACPHCLRLVYDPAWLAS